MEGPWVDHGYQWSVFNPLPTLRPPHRHSILVVYPTCTLPLPNPQTHQW